MSAMVKEKIWAPAQSGQTPVASKAWVVGRPQRGHGTGEAGGGELMGRDSAAKNVEEVLEFLVGVGGIFERRGDLELHEFGEAAREAVQPDGDGGARRVEGGGDAIVVTGAGGGVEERLERSEGGATTGGALLGLEAAHGLTEERDGPRQLVGFAGVELRVIDGGVFALGVEAGEIDEGEVAAAFLRVGVGSLVTDKLAERADEVAAKTAALRIGAVKKIAGEQVREEGLRGVLGIGGRVAAATQIAVNGRPVDAAECFECGTAAGRIAAGIADDAPLGRRESPVARSGGDGVRAGVDHARGYAGTRGS